MKKLLLAIIACSMLLSTAAFATTKTTDTKNVSSTNGETFHLQSRDPDGW